MFIFGSSENTRNLYLSNSLANIGPELPSTSFDELNQADQKALFAYIYMAYEDALEDGVSGEDLSGIAELYDETFLKMAQGHPDFRKAVLGGFHQYLPDYSEANISKYQGIVSALQES